MLHTVTPRGQMAFTTVRGVPVSGSTCSFRKGASPPHPALRQQLPWPHLPSPLYLPKLVAGGAALLLSTCMAPYNSERTCLYFHAWAKHQSQCPGKQSHWALWTIGKTKQGRLWTWHPQRKCQEELASLRAGGAGPVASLGALVSLAPPQDSPAENHSRQL